MTLQYATAQEFRQWPSGMSAQLPGEDATVDLMLQEASEYIDNFCGHGPGGFLAAGSFQQPFDGNGKADLYIPYAVSISAITVNGSALPSSAWVGYPFVTWRPYHRVKLVQQVTAFAQSTYDTFPGGSVNYWPRGQQNVGITAVWGFSATPPAGIKKACIQLAGMNLKVRGAPAFAIAGGASGQSNPNPSGGGPTQSSIEAALRYFRRQEPL